MKPAEPDRPVIPLADAGRQVIPVADAGRQVIPVADAGRQVIPVADAGRQVIPVADAGRQVIPVADAGSQVIRVTDAGHPVKTAAETGHSLTAAEVLFGPSADTSEALTRHIMSAGDVRHAFNRLSRSTRHAAVREATAAAAALLKVDLLGVLVSGWREHREIVSAARRTLTSVSSRELVSLPAHRVATAQQPSVSILVDGKKVAFLRLGLSIIADIEALVAGISTGRLSAVHAGRCSVGVALTVHELEVLNKRAHLELPGAFRLKSGIRLLPHGEYPHGVHPGLEIPVGPQESHFPAVAFAGAEHPASTQYSGGAEHPGGSVHAGNPVGEHQGFPGPEHHGNPSPGGDHRGSSAGERPSSPPGSPPPGSPRHGSHPPGPQSPPWWESVGPDRRG